MSTTKHTPGRCDEDLALPISLIMWALIIWGTLCLLGCSSLEPNYIAPEIEHMSHATQHEPFTEHPTRYGANMVGLVAGYNLTGHLNLEIAESENLSPHYATIPSDGEIIGPREQFSARLRYTMEIRR